MLLQTLTRFLDETLALPDFSGDVSNNGLQLEGNREVTRAVFAVDASGESIRFAADHHAQFLFVHHGLSWGSAPRRLTGITARRFGTLFQHQISLYAVHLPLDAHPELGNNAVLSETIEMRERRPFFQWDGMTIGFAGTLARALSPRELAEKLLPVFGGTPRCYGEENRKISRVAVVSGGAGAEALQEAADSGMELLITGEFTHVMYHIARELDLPVLALGHYASETGGVKAVMKLLEKKFSLETLFADFPTGL